MPRLSQAKDYHVTNPTIFMLEGTITLKGEYWLCCTNLRWCLWDNDPDDNGEIVIHLELGLAVTLEDEQQITVSPLPGTKLEYAATDYELVKELELERANKAYELAKQITELYQD